MTYSTYFLNCLPSLLTNVKGAKGVNISNPWPKSAYARVFYIKSSGTKGTGTKDICVISVYSRGICIKGICI